MFPNIDIIEYALLGYIDVSKANEHNEDQEVIDTKIAKAEEALLFINSLKD